MPPTQRGQAYKLPSGRGWGLRYYDAGGARRRKSPFASKSAALAHYRDVIEPQLLGEPAPLPELTLAELVDIYLERHAANVRPRTIITLRERLRLAVDAFEPFVSADSLAEILGVSTAAIKQLVRDGLPSDDRGRRFRASQAITWAVGEGLFDDDAALAARERAARTASVPLSELERMSGEIASWQARLPERSRYGVVQALRQTLGAAVRWGYISRNPATLAGRNRQPAPRPVRVYTRDELDALGAELAPMYAPLPIFAAATGLRPEEWQALERRDVDRRERVVNVLRTVSDGEIVELGKTSGARRQVPLSRRALAALEAIPPRLDTPLVFPAPHGGVLNLDNWRRRAWAPAVEASGVPRPARIYDLRSTFASDALAASVSVFELARIMGTSVRMIERHYGALLDGAGAGIAGRLDALDDERDQAADGAADDV